MLAVDFLHGCCIVFPLPYRALQMQLKGQFAFGNFCRDDLGYCKQDGDVVYSVTCICFFFIINSSILYITLPF